MSAALETPDSEIVPTVPTSADVSVSLRKP